MTEEQAAKPQRHGQNDPATDNPRFESNATGERPANQAGGAGREAGPRPNEFEGAQQAGQGTPWEADEGLDAGQAGTGRPGAARDEQSARVAELEARCAALQDQYLRAVAETENVRRRGQEDLAKAHKYAIEGFAEALLPVLDSLELALKSESPSVENMREGVEATLRLFGSVFEKNRLKVIDPAGEKFDPNLHQAISTVPANAVQPPVAPNHVANVLQKGYLINDRVLRPALVTVAQG